MEGEYKNMYLSAKSFVEKFYRSSVVIAMCIILISIILSILLFILPLFGSCVTDYWTTLLAVFISIANALLLYATLKSQQGSIKNEKTSHRQERFETTFFNLLESNRKLINEISVSWNDVSKGYIDSMTISGNMFFNMAVSELAQILSSLESGIREGYNQKEIDEIFMAHEEYKSCDKKDLQRIIDETKIKYSNSFYSITKEDSEKYKSDEGLIYKIFQRKWYFVYEQYIRNLYYMLEYVNREMGEKEAEQRKYVSIIQSQMGRNEINIISEHAKAFLKFKKIIDKTHLIDLKITTQNSHEENC